MSSSIQQVLIPVEAGYETVEVEIAGERIGAIAPVSTTPPTADTPVINGQNKLLLPGFTNTHTHSSQIWLRGLVAPLPLELWLANVFDGTSTEAEQFYLGALLTGVNALLSGATCVLDHAYLMPDREIETIEAVVRGYREVGIRALVAPLIQDLAFVQGFPQGRSLPHKPPTRSAAELLAVMEEIVRRFHDPEAGIQIAVGPTGFQRCSDELFAGCVDLSNRYNLCRHTHLLETKAQKLLAQEKYGRSVVKHLQGLGFLDHRTTLAHGVWLSDRDIEILAETRSTVVHNPVSNLRLGSGIAPVLKYLQAGVNVALGCDGAASNDAQDMLEVIKLSTILHTITDPDYHQWITPRQAIAMATVGGATGVNLADQTGSLTPGKFADLVLYDLTNLSLLPRTDPLQLLVLGRPNCAVDYVWVRGRPVVAEGRVQTVDVAALRQELLDRSLHASQPSFQMIHQVETHYRKVMDLPPL